MMFVSYNGQLNLHEEHFGDIVRNCSIITDHRLVLFANFTHFFEQEELQLSEDEEHADKLLCMHELYQKYLGYRLEDINQERLYGNLSLFLKYGPGLLSMEDRVFGAPSMKYSMGRLYQYLGMLGQLEQFQFIEKHTLRKWNSEELSKLYESYLGWEIKENRKENKYYDNLLSVVVAELLCKNISQAQLETLLGKRLFYRYRFLLQELAIEQAEIARITQMGSSEMAEESVMEPGEGLMGLLEVHLEMEKEKLLAENFENYKTKKFFYLAENQKSFGQVNCLRFVLGSGSN